MRQCDDYTACGGEVNKVKRATPRRRDAGIGNAKGEIEHAGRGNAPARRLSSIGMRIYYYDAS